VYSNNQFIVAFFALLWLADLGALIIVPFSASSTHIGPTKACIPIHVKFRWYVISAILHSAYDALVFVAISFRIVSHSMIGNDFGARMKSLVLGDGLPRLSKIVLQGGQMFYLFVTFYFVFLVVAHDFSSSTTSGLGIVVAILYVAPVPLFYKVAFVAPRLMLDSSMACRVFRGLKLGSIQDLEQYSAQSPMRFTTQNSSTMGGRSNEVGSHELKGHLAFASKVESEQETETKDDGSVVPSHWV
jgi:hypothetical protein